MHPHIQRLVSKGVFLRRQMWKQKAESNTKGEAALYAIMRVVAITFAGLKENRIVNRAAALSFSSLLGLGPIIALMVLVSGFVLNQTQPDMAQKTIENALNFVAPQASIGEGDEGNNELGALISRFIEASQSGAVGVVGMITLILIVIQLFTTIEDAFNDIWAVQRGRPLITRVILYWTTISLGTLLVFAGIAVAIGEAVRFGNMMEALPGSAFADWLAIYGTKIVSALVFASVLTLFYRFIPNTQVEWKAAAIGALFTVVFFSLLNYATFLYVERVAMQRTLYGSLGILPVLMIGFFFSWTLLLLGGRVSFAVQNARFKGGKIAWDGLSHAAQESLCLLLLVQVSRQFKLCKKPLSTIELATSHRLPKQLASAAMHRLCKIGFTSALPPKENTPFDAYRYQPAQPLEKIRLIDFKRGFESNGQTPDEDLFNSYDPLVAKYHDLLNSANQSSLREITIDSALEEID